MTRNLNFEDKINVLTALGALPLYFCLLSSYISIGTLQDFTLIYLTVITSFIAGINWCLALKLESITVALWAVVMSLLPVGIMVAFNFGYYNFMIALALFKVATWITYFADRQIYRMADIEPYIKFRLFGSISISMAMMACLITLYE